MLSWSRVYDDIGTDHMLNADKLKNYRQKKGFLETNNDSHNFFARIGGDNNICVHMEEWINARNDQESLMILQDIERFKMATVAAILDVE